MKIKKIITGVLSFMMLFSSLAGNMSYVSAQTVTEIIAEKNEISADEKTDVTVNAVIPENAEVISYEWSSDNETVATVSGESYTASVEGKAAGKAKITAVVNYEVKNDTEENTEALTGTVSAETEITVKEISAAEQDVSEAVKATEETETESDASKTAYDPEAVDYIAEKNDSSLVSGDLVLSNALIVKNMLVDGTMYKDGDTVDSIMASEKGDEMFIATLKSVIALYSNEDSSYYVGYANTMQNDSKADVKDYIFAMNNENGEVLNDCIYDYDSGLAYIPKSYFKSDDGIIAGNVQVQFLQVVKQNTEKVKSQVEYVTTDGDEVKTGDKKIDAFDFETKVQTEKGLSNSEFTVSLNGVPVDSDGYTYNSDTGVVTIPVSSVSVQSVSVEVHEKNVLAKAVDSFFDVKEVSALSMAEMGCAGTIDLPDGASVGSAWDVTLYNAYASDWGGPTVDAYGYFSEQELVNLSSYGGNIDWNKVIHQTQQMYLGIFAVGGPGIGPSGGIENMPSLWNYSIEGATGSPDGWIRLQCTHVSNPLGNDSNVNWGYAPVRFRVLAISDDGTEVVMSVLSRRVNTQSGSSIVKFKVRRKTGNLEITKVSENTSISENNPCYSLAGAEYQLKDGAGNTVATLTTDTSGKASASNIAAGNYTLVETKASPGYELNTGSTAVTINAGQTTTLSGTGVLIETPANDPVAIQIMKIDADNKTSTAQGNASLEGAEFTVKYYDDYYDKATDLPSKATRTWVLATKKDSRGGFRAALRDNYKVSGDEFYKDSDGTVVLPLGTITIQETKAPNGYKLEGATLVEGNGSTANIDNNVYLTKITQEDNGDPGLVVAGNLATVKDEVKKQHVEIEKLSKNAAGITSSLNGATFTIKLKSDVESVGWDRAEVYDQVTTARVNGKDGMAVTKDLPFGTYIMRETVTPSGYVKADDIQFTIDKDQSEIKNTQHFTVVDNENHIRIYKYDVETEAPLKNAKYRLFNVTDNKEAGTYTTGENGIIDLYKLANGKTYYIQEVSAPAGYKINDTKYYFEYDANGYVSISDKNSADVDRGVFKINSKGDMQISLSNKLAYFDIDLTKLNDADRKLKGAVFTLYSDQACTKEVASATTDGNGHLKFENVEVGTYWLKETKAPAGYRKLLDPIKVSFRCVNKKHTFFVNDVDVTNGGSGNYSMSLVNDRYTGNMTIVNKRGSQLPATGSSGALLLIGAGCAVCALGIAVSRKKKKAKGEK